MARRTLSQTLHTEHGTFKNIKTKYVLGSWWYHVAGPGPWCKTEMDIDEAQISFTVYCLLADEVQEARGRWKQKQRRAHCAGKLGTNDAASARSEGQQQQQQQQQEEMMRSDAFDVGAEVLPAASRGTDQAPLAALIPWG
eukprot:scaffold14127_cov23-Tisochrysis_lutea.AAC.2